MKQCAYVILALFAYALLGLSPAMAELTCNEVEDPYKGGRYASRILTFKPGYWIQTRGPLATGYRTFLQKQPLHHTRTMFPESRVLGCPKPTLEAALTLGHEGYVVVGTSDCFRAGQGPDIIIHEPRSDMNLNESFNVYVTPDLNGNGPWYPVAHDIVVSNANNFLELELEGIKDRNGRLVEEFYWVKVEDANSKLVFSHERFSGFDISAVKFMHQCSVPVGWLNTDKWQKHRLSAVDSLRTMPRGLNKDPIGLGSETQTATKGRNKRNLERLGQSAWVRQAQPPKRPIGTILKRTRDPT